MVDTIINTLERQVNCINKTNFSISILRQCVKSRPKIFDANIQAIAKFMSKFLTMQIA